MSRRIHFSQSVAIALFLTAAPLFGLDPDRSLTQYLHRIWQTQQGFTQATIHSIAQTSDGYLWLGTEKGLVRFDGVKFSPMTDISSQAVSQLLEDRQHALWIASDGHGLLQYKQGHLTRFTQGEGLPSDSVTCVASGAGDDIWACTPNGLARIAGGQVRAFTTADGLASNEFAAACLTSDGRVWAGGASDELSVGNGNGFTAYRLRTMPRYAKVQAMLAARDGSVWIGSSSGLIRLLKGVETRFSKADGLASDSVLSLMEGQDGTVWAGTTDGFSRLRQGRIERFGTRQGLSQSAVYALSEDREGSLWAGTKRGLNQFLDRRTVPVTTAEGLPSNDSGPVFEDAAGTVWVGTLDAGLARIRGDKTTIISAKDGLSSNSVRALAGDGSGNLWVGTDNGLDLMRGGRVVGRYTSQQGLPSSSIRSLYEDRRGTLWIGTTSGTAVYRNSHILRPRESVATRQPVASFAEDNAGHVFAASGLDGIRVYAEGSLQELTDKTFSIRDVDELFSDPDGMVLAGTLGNGLYLLDGTQAVRISMKDGLFDDDIYGIASDRQGSFWMACSKGMFSVHRTELLKFAKGEIHRVVSTPYSPLDGMQALEGKAGVAPSVWQMHDGRIWFSTIRGLLVFDPRRLELKLTPPPVAIEIVSIDGRDYDPNALPKIAAGSRNLEFQYTGLSFRSPTRLTFRYILESFDRSWTDADTRREASYTNLPPGSYRFRVAACNVDGTCNSTGASVAFVLPARFYQQAWFWPLSALILAGLVRFAYVVRIQRIKQHFDIALNERVRIARELHDTLIQGFSGVTMQMQALSPRLSKDHQSTIGEIIRDAAICLREARQSVSNLRGEWPSQSGLAGEIAQAAKQAAGLSGNRLKLSLEPVSGLSAHVEQNLLKIAREAITNSAKHSGADHIEVVLGARADSVVLSVRDNGSGFPERDEGAPRGHYGLVGMRERAESIGADFRLSSRPGAGTIVSVSVPIAKEQRSVAPGVVHGD